MAHVTNARGGDYEVGRGPDWLFVRPVLSSKSAADTLPLHERVWSLMEQHFTHRLVLEMGDVVCLDSQLIGELLALYEQIHSHDGMMRICGLSSENQELLRKCELEGHFPRFRDREEAVMGRPSCPR